MLLKFQLEEVCYQPGDHMFVFPENAGDLVNAVLEGIEKPFPVDESFLLHYLNQSKMIICK